MNADDYARIFHLREQLKAQEAMFVQKATDIARAKGMPGDARDAKFAFESERVYVSWSSGYTDDDNHMSFEAALLLDPNAIDTVQKEQRDRALAFARERERMHREYAARDEVLLASKTVQLECLKANARAIDIRAEIRRVEDEIDSLRRSIRTHRAEAESQAEALKGK